VRDKGKNGNKKNIDLHHQRPGKEVVEEPMHAVRKKVGGDARSERRRDLVCGLAGGKSPVGEVKVKGLPWTKVRMQKTAILQRRLHGNQPPEGRLIGGAQAKAGDFGKTCPM